MLDIKLLNVLHIYEIFGFLYFHSYLCLFSLLTFQTVNLTLAKGENDRKNMTI